MKTLTIKLAVLAILLPLTAAGCEDDPDDVYDDPNEAAAGTAAPTPPPADQTPPAGQ